MSSSKRPAPKSKGTRSAANDAEPASVLSSGNAAGGKTRTKAKASAKDAKDIVAPAKEAAPSKEKVKATASKGASKELRKVDGTPKDGANKGAAKVALAKPALTGEVPSKGASSKAGAGKAVAGKAELTKAHAAEVRAAEVRATEAHASEARAAEVRASEARASEARASEVSGAEAKGAEAKAAEARVLAASKAPARDTEVKDTVKSPAAESAAPVHPFGGSRPSNRPAAPATNGGLRSASMPPAPPPPTRTPQRLPPRPMAELAARPSTPPPPLAPVKFNVGDKAVHPAHGVGEVTAVETRDIGGSKQDFYVLRILDNGMKVMVPTNAAAAVGLREIMSDAEADAILETMRAREVAVDVQPWSRRFRIYTEMIKSKSPHEIAKVMRDMHRLKFDKDLSFGERRLLDQARSLLMKELALAKRMTEPQLEAEVQALFAS